MAIPKILGAQRDFSAGELDEAMKRADENPIMKIGARQALNWRILSGGQAANRPGRSVLFLETGRVEEVLMSPGNIFYLAFGNGYLRVYNAAGTQVFASTKKGDGSTNIPWTTATVKDVGFTAATSGSPPTIYITYGDDAPLNVPQSLMWDGISQTSTWTLSTYAETITAGGQKRTLFFRISPKNVTMLPSASTGNIDITFSSPVLVSGMVNTRMTFCGRQILITAVTLADFVTPTAGPSEFGTATVEESLPIGQTLDVGPSFVGFFNVGDEVTGSITGATGIITSINSGASTLTVQLLQSGDANQGTIGFTSPDVVVGPGGAATLGAGTVAATTPQPVSVWEDEVMNLFRGYPTSTFFDQSRLGFCNFPSVPSGVAWSAISLPLDLYVAALPDSAIFELAPDKVQVLFVVAGAESSEFVFCDNAVYYIPINVANPLVPGSVSFNILSKQGCFPNVKPQAIEQSILFVKAGGMMISAVQTPGAYYRPNIIDNVSEFHGHLFKASPPIAIAVPTGATQYEETYAYILLANGTLVTGKFGVRQGLLEAGQDGKPKIGWLPWNGAGTVEWISAQGSDLIFTTSYAPNGVTAVSVVEKLDNTQYVDGGLSVNSLPAPFTPPGGKGPLYVFPGPGGAVTLMDNVTRMMGTYQIDANGNIIPQGNAGENLSSAQLVAGQPWTATLEPFAPDASAGNSIHQRMFKRRISRFAVYVSNSTGFLMARLFSGPLTRTSPALGTIMNTRRITTWNQDDDPTQPPPLREEAQRWRPLGRAYDPRVAVIKDTPGPLLVHEVGLEASI
jgi:hypothetical protein